MNHVAGMQVLCRPEQLVEDVLLVNFFEDVASFDDIVQVRVWWIENIGLATTSKLKVN